MKKRINLNKQYLNFIKIKTFITDKDGFFYQRKRGRGHFFDSRDVIVNIDFIEQIDVPVKEDVYVKNYNDSSYTTDELYFFRIKLSSGEDIYVAGDDFKKFKFLLDNE